MNSTQAGYGTHPKLAGVVMNWEIVFEDVLLDPGHVDQDWRGPVVRAAK